MVRLLFATQLQLLRGDRKSRKLSPLHFWLMSLLGVHPTDFCNARKTLGLTQHGLAEALRMGKHGWQTISAWENGKQPIPGPVTLALECLLERSA